MQLLKQRISNPLYLGGIIAVALSASIYSLPALGLVDSAHAGGLFVLNYAATAAYAIVLLINRSKLKEQGRVHYIGLLLVLAFISAWSLNTGVPVFERSADWFSILLAVCCANYLGMAYAEAFPKWAVHTLSFIAGISFATFLYLAIYLLPWYAISSIGLLFFGISVHTFVPLFFTIYTVSAMKNLSAIHHRSWMGFFGGLLASLLFIVSYIGLWSNVQNKIKQAWAGHERNSDLPQWVAVVKDVPQGFFAKRILQTELVYSVPESGGTDFFWSLPRNSFADDISCHDPLVMLSVFFTGKLAIDRADRVKILRSMHGLAHETQERLWSGEDLFTRQVNTSVKVWPACNMAYTEKTLTVHNGLVQNWGGQQEAIYTFYMPEGSVVTSLSLWIEGREEKGILTTTGRADSAYKRIVGIESRDPSVVHWQEGNTVSVRVFPVLPESTRMFKIGITSPLKRINGKLQYENIYFKGPSWRAAEEDIQIDFEQPASDFDMPARFTSMPMKQSYSRKGRYQPSWTMQIKDPGLENCTFSFDNNTYSLAPYHKKLSTATFNKIYLDINSSWTKDEFNRVVDMTSGREVYVYDHSLERLTSDNQREIWSRLRQRQFSLFPFYVINDPAQSLLITHNRFVSPSLDELEGSVFLEKTRRFLGRGEKIKLFDLGTELSPYLRSLKELRAFQYDQGDIQALADLLTKSHFPDDLEDDSQVIIHQSDMLIRKRPGMAASSGPDHLMRLFTYNHIMQKLGTDLFTNRLPDDSLVDEAAKAYVVTPVSSLVVLETQQDYDRFDIKDREGASLKNASMQSKGAVPEPHEWALIILALLTLAYVVKRRKLRFG